LDETTPGAALASIFTWRGPGSQREVRVEALQGPAETARCRSTGHNLVLVGWGLRAALRL